MRNRKAFRGLTINAIAGTYVIFFGLDLTPAKRVGFRGFAFMRLDHATGEAVWLRGIKTFEKTAPHPALGVTFSTREQPVQSFQWADYAVKPGRSYTYTIAALYGDPAQLEARIQTTIAISTESEVGSTHSAFFNRGSVATQEYARRFQNRPPSVAGPSAYAWLSRGLLEALLAFIGRAKKGWAIHGAVYEFQWPGALDALKKAAQRGAEVHILFDDIAGGPRSRNRAAIAAAGIDALCKGRANGRLMHHKFFVLSRVEATTGVLSPAAVWTGSTNLTENGIFGHANAGHIVADAAIAAGYLEAWRRLDADPKVDAAYRAINTAATPAPPKPWKALTTPVFSPRGTTASRYDALDWYAAIAGGAKRALMMTFAFGMDERFKNVYRSDDAILRMALLDREGNPATLAQDRLDLKAIRARPNVVVAVGNDIATNAFDRWLAELSRIVQRVNVPWVHTKFMLVDPLGRIPTVVSGSANFSKASTEANDENMLVVRGDRRVSDIYFGEYLRLYNHYAFRESVKRYMERTGQPTPTDWTPQYLIDDDRWMADYFDPNDSSARYLRRVYFGGPMTPSIAQPSPA